jgi:HD-GYP domain-containing protein (c-di-GMP phosphodiesterase class II)
MESKGSDYVDVRNLRVGLYVELELGWMAHPFPTGSFKITNSRQIETIRGLGVERVRCVVSKSDPESAEQGVDVLKSASNNVVSEKVLAAEREKALRQQRAELLGAQQRSLVVCERRFGEATRLYRKTMEQVKTQPKAVTQECRDMVQGLVGEMLGEGETAIRLLTEVSGDKSAMHPVNVAVVSLLLGKAMGLEEADLMDLGMAAFLHDMGKSQMPDRVRYPEENFSNAEFKQYQAHVAHSLSLGKDMALSLPIMTAIAEHHELADGSGYPMHMKGEEMTQAAQILALVNRYDNLCNPGRSPIMLTPHESLSLIFTQLKTRFDGVALSAFIRMMGVYPPGSVVQLSDDRYAMVVSVNSARPLKPRVIVHDADIPKHEALILDLERNPQFSIRRSLKPASLPSAALDYLSPRARVCYFFEKVTEPPLPAPEV